jgi:hypothetical protein
MKPGRTLQRIPAPRAGCLLICLIMLSSTGTDAGPADLLAQGRRLYREGIAPDGQPLQAIGAAEVAISGADAACERCHRRSGMGSREGSIPVPAVSGPVLFSKLEPAQAARRGHSPPVMPQRHQARPAYDEAALAKALREGLDPLNRPLNPLMPRYALDEPSLKALTAYLSQLSTAAPPGLENGTLHLATVTTPDADSTRSQTVTETLQSWASASPSTRIALQVWHLSGPESGWENQLRRFYRDRPVYAILSGAGGMHWEPIQAFCESTSTPCLFPVLDQIPQAHDGYYAMYLGGGLGLESALLIRYLNELPAQPARIVQLFDSERGASVAVHLERQFQAGRVISHAWSGDAPAALADDLKSADTWLLWLRPEQVATLAAAFPQGPGAGRIILSERLCPPDKLELPPAWQARTAWISERTSPSVRHGRALLGLIPWLKQLNLPAGDEATQSEVYAAVFYFNDALARMRGNPTREYLMETLETAVDDRPPGASYYRLSLGPGQRVASRLGHLMTYSGAGPGQPENVGPALLP